MIVDVHGERILATPARCGTYTSEAVARSLQYVCVRPGLHRMIVPHEYELFDRYIQVRNPYGRLESIYHYLHDPQNYSQWGARYVSQMDFTEALLFLSDAKRERASVAWKIGILNTLRSPDLWLLSLKENADLLECVDVVRMDCGELEKWFGRPLGHKHRRRNVGVSKWTSYNLRIANDLLGARADCEWLGYDVRRK